MGETNKQTKTGPRDAIGFALNLKIYNLYRVMEDGNQVQTSLNVGKELSITILLEGQSLNLVKSLLWLFLVTRNYLEEISTLVVAQLLTSFIALEDMQQRW